MALLIELIAVNLLGLVYRGVGLDDYKQSQRFVFSYINWVWGGGT